MTVKSRGLAEIVPVVDIEARRLAHDEYYERRLARAGALRNAGDAVSRDPGWMRSGGDGAAVAARGIDLWFGPQEEGWEVWRSRLLKFLVGAGLLAWALLFWQYLNLRFDTDPGDRVILSSLVAFVLAAVLHGLQRGQVTTRAARVAVALLMLFEMSIASNYFFSHRDDP